MPQDLARDLEPLLAHAGFVRRLASRLAADPHDAEDLSQETWLALLRRRATLRGEPRAFLAGVLRRRVLEQRREPASAPFAAEALERAELGRERRAGSLIRDANVRT